MNRMRVALVHKIVPVSVVAFLLFCTPLPLAAQERESRAADQVVIAWFSGLWSDLTAWLAGAVETPQPPPGSFHDGRCAVDPNGCPEGQ